MLYKIIECPEAQDAGTIILTGFEPDIVLNSIKTVIDQFNSMSSEAFAKEGPIDYSITGTSWRVLKLILGNTKLSNKWHGINQ